jgi:AcrR family transcriptional regulator
MRIATDHREVILVTAARLFARKPFHEVLMDDVAEQAGIAKGTIYRHFPNKEELFSAMSFWYLETISAELEIVAGHKDPPLARLRQMVVRVVEVIQERQDFFQVMQRHELNLWAQKRDDFMARRTMIRSHFLNVMNEAIEQKALRVPFKAEIAADMLLGMIRSLLRFSVPQPTPDEAAGMAMHLFLNGLKADRTGGKS